MEITDRDDLGEALWAPQHDFRGGESWSYSRLTYVQPGDRVFHWHKTQAGEPAIVGWSEAGGPIRVETKSWQARGTRGRERGVPTLGPAWVVPLHGLWLLDKPITRSAINARYREITELLAESRKVAEGAPYAPFQNYGGRELRAQQGYLTKFPVALVDLLFAGISSTSSAESDVSEKSPVRVGHDQAYMSDAEMRSSIELYAVKLASDMYYSEGATEIIELGKPYDLRVIVHEIERHVEVKGSTGKDLASVQLTQGEVVHAANWQPTDLVVVDGIKCWRDDDGHVLTSGGILRIWRDWQPLQANLAPTHHKYSLPDSV